MPGSKGVMPIAELVSRIRGGSEEQGWEQQKALWKWCYTKVRLTVRTAAVDEVPVKRIELSWRSEIDCDHGPQKLDYWGPADFFYDL